MVSDIKHVTLSNNLAITSNVKFTCLLGQRPRQRLNSLLFCAGSDWVTSRSVFWNYIWWLHYEHRALSQQTNENTYNNDLTNTRRVRSVSRNIFWHVIDNCKSRSWSLSISVFWQDDLLLMIVAHVAVLPDQTLGQLLGHTRARGPQVVCVLKDVT